ncbi:hypothetical protein G5B31_07895 [Rhodobacter sp. SGA-6-6]|uniref:hypothetical protein n=1 Tax=Rhodobacter sp. SGA-6-6 TaxID=2710882 RepID=UPI0013EDBED9|nr:hypothetical protein [Rhodobacter sp. SGA-6-6]NGM45457.1 hypothetical protein [Rhodobacter sp. SGA-6-6]
MKPVTLTLLAALLPGIAAAEDWQLAGHSVTLEDVADGGSRLSADGAVVLEDWLLLTDGAGPMPGGAAVWGVSGPGGNACDAAPFVLWLPEGGAARLDGPVDTCTTLEAQVGPDSITWDSEPVPGEMSESWIWTPAGGIVAGPSTPFAPDAGRGWEALPELADAHPADALRLEPVYRALEAGLGPDFPAYEERISGLGSGGLEGADYAGRACIKLVCETDFAGLWLDAARREVFAWWRNDADGALRLFPADRVLWPEGALAKLAEED